MVHVYVVKRSLRVGKETPIYDFVISLSSSFIINNVYYVICFQRVQRRNVVGTLLILSMINLVWLDFLIYLFPIMTFVFILLIVAGINRTCRILTKQDRSKVSV